MLYFAYGSNMSVRRLVSRVPSARVVNRAQLIRHELKFHKASRDGSSKCDAAATDDPTCLIWGVVFEIARSEKPALDLKEGLGYGYNEKVVTVVTTAQSSLEAITYYATAIDPTLKPYHWYKEHVLRGANENQLPQQYIQQIEAVDSIEDPEWDRHTQELAIYMD